MTKTYMYGRYQKRVINALNMASLYETFKIQHPSFNILIIIIIIIIIITFTSTAPFSLLSNGALQQQLL